MRRKILNNFIRDSYLKEVLEGKYLEIMFTWAAQIESNRNSDSGIWDSEVGGWNVVIYFIFLVSLLA
jgi:uncharacterized cupin superfamily protein